MSMAGSPSKHSNICSDCGDLGVARKKLKNRGRSQAPCFKLLRYENIPSPSGLCSSELLRHDTTGRPNGPPLAESPAGPRARPRIPYLERRKAVRSGFADPSELDCAGTADAPDNTGLRLICNGKRPVRLRIKEPRGRIRVPQSWCATARSSSLLREICVRDRSWSQILDGNPWWEN
jgi:hypothetical protein